MNKRNVLFEIYGIFQRLLFEHFEGKWKNDVNESLKKKKSDFFWKKSVLRIYIFKEWNKATHFQFLYPPADPAHTLTLICLFLLLWPLFIISSKVLPMRQPSSQGCYRSSSSPDCVVLQCFLLYNCRFWFPQFFFILHELLQRTGKPEPFPIYYYGYLFF